jgi:hypothetical protein
LFFAASFYTVWILITRETRPLNRVNIAATRGTNERLVESVCLRGSVEDIEPAAAALREIQFGSAQIN